MAREKQTITSKDIGIIEASALVPKPVVATMTASNSRTSRQQAKRIEAAMVEAVKACHKKGILDPDEIRAAMMEAREAAKR